MSTDTVTEDGLKQKRAMTLRVIGAVIVVTTILGIAVTACMFRPDSVYALVSGYSLSLIVGTVVTGLFYCVLPESTSSRNEDFFLELPAVVGIVERILYTTLAVFGVYSLITGWFILKAVIRFKKDREHEFNAYLIGTGLSVLFGLAGGVLTRLMMGLPIVPAG